jgi:hypothetical protein
MKFRIKFKKTMQLEEIQKFISVYIKKIDSVSEEIKDYSLYYEIELDESQIKDIKKTVRTLNMALDDNLLESVEDIRLVETSFSIDAEKSKIDHSFIYDSI